jgi:hypothetical protein
MYKRIDKICLHCNNTYSGTKASKYCGYDCAKASRKKRVTLNCQDCNKEFEVQEWNKDAKFCSYSCKVKNQSSNIVDITCNSCQTTFKRKEHKIGKHNFCSKSCANEFNKGVNHYEWKEHLHDKNKKLALKQWALKVKERDNYTCQLCYENSDRKLMEAHHMKHRSQFPELQFDFSNGITLCLKCHALQHINDPKALRLITHKINKYYV